MDSFADFEGASLCGKLSKCGFLLSEVAFLGHVVSVAGIVVDLTKVEVVLRWERSTSMIEICSFLSLAGYYRRFIQYFPPWQPLSQG